MKLKNLLQGKLGRAKYFSYTLIAVVSLYLALVAYRSIFGVPGDELALFFLAFFFIIVVLTIRRLHDLNLRGGWALFAPISFLIGFVYFLSILFDPSPSFFLYFPILFLGALNAIAFLFLFIKGGTSGINRFGEAPLR